MKKILIGLCMSGLFLTLTSCDNSDDILPTTGLTEAEIIEGLKSALRVATDTSVSRLNVTDGYHKDAIVKIFLPPEASVIVDNISRLPGGMAVVDDMILKINRAAEDAAVEATPIFVDAITNITITDGKAILEGNDDAATVYLKGATYVDLSNVFEPKIKVSLDKKIIGSISAESAYGTMIQSYNAGSLNGVLYPKISTNTLSRHTTEKGLDGLFIKLADEEKEIRTNLSHQVNDLLKKVFG